MSDGGKGSAPRPIEVPKDEFNRRWEETFGKQKQPEPTRYCPYCLHEQEEPTCCGQSEFKLYNELTCKDQDKIDEMENT